MVLFGLCCVGVCLLLGLGWSWFRSVFALVVLSWVGLGFGLGWDDRSLMSTYVDGDGDGDKYVDDPRT